MSSSARLAAGGLGTSDAWQCEMKPQSAGAKRRGHPPFCLLVVDEKHVDHLENPRENVHVDGLGHGISVLPGVEVVQILGDGFAWKWEEAVEGDR